MRKNLLLTVFAILGLLAKSQNLTFSNEIVLTNVQPYQYNSVQVCRFSNNSSIFDFLATYGNKLVWYETDYNQTLTEHQIDEVSGGSYPHFFTAKACQIVNDYSNIHDDVIALYRDNNDNNNIKLVYYTNDGNNNFSSANIISSEISAPANIIVKDVNHDLCADIFVPTNDNILLFLNDGSGNFTHDTITVGKLIKAIDFNNDNNIDIIFKNTNNDLQWLEGDGAGNFSNAQTLITSQSTTDRILVEDFDSDGDKDIVTQDYYNTLKLYVNDGAENFTFDHEVFSQSDSWATSLAPGNFDGNWNTEYNDILTGVSSFGAAPQISLLINDDNGNFIDTIQFTTSSDTVISLYSVDFNSDTCMDIVAATCYNIIWFKGMSCDATTDVYNFGKEKEVSLYPNPTKNTLYIEVKNEKLKSKDDDRNIVFVYDIYGREVKQFKIQNSKYKINVSDLEKGVYFVKVGNTLRKFIKE